MLVDIAPNSGVSYRDRGAERQTRRNRSIAGGTNRCDRSASSPSQSWQRPRFVPAGRLVGDRSRADTTASRRGAAPSDRGADARPDRGRQRGPSVVEKRFGPGEGSAQHCRDGAGGGQRFVQFGAQSPRMAHADLRAGTSRQSRLSRKRWRRELASDAARHLGARACRQWESFSFSRTLTVTPLHDVLVAALRFQHFSPCETVVNGDFRLDINTPGGYRTVKFKLGFNELNNGARVSLVAACSRHASQPSGADRDLLRKRLQARHRLQNADWSGPSLLPGQDKKYSFILNEEKPVRQDHLPDRPAAKRTSAICLSASC